MGNNYFTGIEDFLHVDNYYDKLIEKNFKENEDKIKGDFKAKIRNLQNFYEEMNKKYDFQHLTKTDLHKKLKEINSINKARRRLSHKKEEPFIPLGFYLRYIIYIHENTIYHSYIINRRNQNTATFKRESRVKQRKPTRNFDKDFRCFSRFGSQ